MLSENHYTELDREADAAERFQQEQKSYVADMLPRKHRILCIDNSSAPSRTAKKNNRGFEELPPRLQELFFAVQKGKSRESGTAPLFRSLLGYEPGDERFCVWQPYTGFGVEFAKDISGFTAVVATGSSAMATEYDEMPWMHQMSEVLAEREKLRIPALFVCFTHQLQAHRSGGKVEWLEDDGGKNTREFGISTIHSTVARDQSSFFSKLPERLAVPASHSQEVVLIPRTAAVTYSNDVSHVQALSYEDTNAWSIQNHPEVLASTLSSILLLRHETIGQEMDDAGPEVSSRHFGATNVEGLRDRIVGSVDAIRGTREAVFRVFLEKVVDHQK